MTHGREMMVDMILFPSLRTLVIRSVSDVVNVFSIVRQMR